MNKLVSPRSEHLELFAVPLTLASELLPPVLLVELAVWVLAERERSAGIQRSNAGGWHSKPDLPMRAEPALDLLFQAVIEQLRELQARVGKSGKDSHSADYPARFSLQAWATVMEAGHYVNIHDHADAHWSFVYYVDAGPENDAQAGGRIAWLNPIGPHRALPHANLSPTSFELQPRAGLLVLFPGWLRHLVQPYFGDRPRICIAGNVEVRAG